MPPIAAVTRLPPSWPVRLGGVLLLGVAYHLAGRLSLEAAVCEGNVSPLWPPAGLALAAVLLHGRWLWPGVLLGNLTVNLLTLAPGVSLAAAAGAAAGTLTAAEVLRRLAVRAELDRLRDVVGLVAAAVAGGALSGTVGPAALGASGAVDLGAVVESVRVWSLGDAAGVLVVLPVALALHHGGLRRIPLTEAALVALVLLLVAVPTLRAEGGQPYVLFPVLAWAGVRLGPAGAAAANLLTATVAVVFAARGMGPFAEATIAQSLLDAQAFLLTMAVTSLVLAAMSAELRAAQAGNAATAAEQLGLRRVATGVAGGLDPDEVLRGVAREVAVLLDLDEGAVVRYVDADRAEVAGAWAPGGREQQPGDVFTMRPDGTLREVRRTAAPALRGGRVAAPVRVEGQLWGAVTGRADVLPDDAGRRLAAFAELAGLAIADARARRALLDQARTDPLTGLANHATFHERVGQELAVARRHGLPLALVVMDLDGFKAVNDTAGHLEGDRVLRGAADCLRAAARAGDVVGRLGGDELALLLPATDAAGAVALADRAREAIGVAGLGAAVSASAGVCDTVHARTAEELLRLADLALYRAKALGGDTTVAWDPVTVGRPSPDEQRRRQDRSSTLAGVRAMARAIDARDARTTRHSERVAVLAAELARRCGWGREDVLRLRQAALVHDVGKIGVPDAILFKPGRLTARERREIERHAELGASIAAGVLDAEQVSWVRGHHERHDGGGYPDGLAGDAIPEGAALLALADAWDAMTVARPYRLPLPPEQAFIEVQAMTATQFAPAAVEAFEAVWAAGGATALLPAAL